MSFLLSPTAAAPALPASPGSRASARSDNQDHRQPGSFDEAMARSREAGQEKAVEPAVRCAASKTVRRLADAEKAPAQDSVNPMAALLVVPLESRLAATMAGRSVDASSIENPEISADAGLSKLLAASGLAADTSGIVVDTEAQTALTSALAAMTPQDAELTPAQVRAVAASHGVRIPDEPRAMAAQADAASASLSDSSSGQGSAGFNSAGPALDGATELLLEAANTTAGTTPLTSASAALQQLGSQALSSMPASVATQLLTPDVGSSEWGKALGQQVIHLSAADRQMTELQLNPPGLGPLKVTLSMNDQQMQAAFVSAHSAVRAAVEAALPQLRALLAESGISLGQTSVGAESQPQTTFSNRQDDSGRSSRASYLGREADKAALLLSASPAVSQRHSSQGLRIDTYA